MRPHSDADAPAVERGVAARLRRLDPNLVVTWRRFIIDPLSGDLILHKGRPIPEPQFYLWRRDDVTDHHYFVDSYPRFTDREVLSLERDVARQMDARYVMGHIAQQRAERIAREREAINARQRDKIAANESRIRDLLDGKRGVREAKAFSAPGVSRRTTPGLIVPDAAEDGWELE